MNEDEQVETLAAGAVTDGRGRVGRMARGAWYGVWAQAVDKILPVAVLLYLARTLSPDDFGVYAFVLTYLMFFQTLSDYGIDTILVRTMSQKPAQRAEILRSGLGLKLLLAILSAALSVALVGLVSGGNVPYGLMAVAALSLPTAYGGAYRAYFRSTLEIKKVFAIAIGRALLYAGGVVVAVMADAGLGALFLALSIANLLTFVVVANRLSKRIKPGFGFRSDIWRELMRGSIPLVANAFAITVSLRIAQVLLMSMRGPVEVGLISAASRVSEAFGVLPEALMVTVYPLMAGLHVSDGERLRRTAERSARYLVVAVGVPVTLCAAAGSEIMAALFGPGFAPAGHLLSILAFTALLGAAGTVTVNLLIAVHQERALLRVAMTFAAVGTLLAYVMIHLYGVTGAAIAMVTASALSQIALAILPSTAAHARPALSAGVRASIAVVAGAATGAALSDHPVIASAVALGVYALTLVVLGVANRDEWEFVKAVVAAARGAPDHA